ncbi:MAG: glutamate--cysteine ligase [Phycisphaerales bacterium]|nr:MAG: glutamate--cysteine ligase [Phycisphaerales bacterium]
MIVRADTLDVAPVCDAVIHARTGGYDEDVEHGDIAWCNELALHVLEFKTNGPAPTLTGALVARFQDEVRLAHETLAPLGARLMPGAMHPWMDPHRELRLWPHGYSTVYEAFDRAFDCTGHGWANLQSSHLNLPFADDEEFGRLHAAIRVILPILPALAAASPFADAKATGLMDTRLEVYRHNARRVPSVSGRIIPEPIFTRDEYENTLLAGLYRDIAPHDPGGALRHEWLNARGAIARFDRDTIEIRVLDTQECPRADIAIHHAVVEVLRGLVEERWSSLCDQQSWGVEPLADMLLRAVKDAGAAPIDNDDYLALFGVPAGGAGTMRDLWGRLIEDVVAVSPHADQVLVGALRAVHREGCLAQRMLRALGTGEPTRDRLHALHAELCACLAEGTLFRA